VWVKVRFFAVAREMVGRSEAEAALPEGAVVQDLREKLYADHPSLEALRLQFAVNRAYASPDTPLREGDEVACIPPVGGG